MTAQARGLLIALIVLVLLSMSGPLMMGGMMAPGWMGTDGAGHWGMMWGAGGLAMLVFLAALVVAVVALVRLLDRPDEPPTARSPSLESPLEIAARRYAMGELTREQYEQMRQDLGRDTRP